MVLAPSTFDSEAAPGGADRRLVEAHRAGDGDAFPQIVRLHYRSLLASARRRLGNQGDAEDAVQETLLRAFRGLDRFGTTGDWRLGAWLGRILANVCCDAGLSRQAGVRLADRLVEAGTPPTRDIADLASDPVALRAVRRALDTLPTSQRQAFVLRVVEDLPYPAVARQLGITEDNARARVQRARTALRHVLTDARAVSGTLAVAPFLLTGTVRAMLRRVASRAPHGRMPPGPSAGAAPPAASSLSAMSGPVMSSSSPALPSVPAVVSAPMNAGAQLVNQLVASPTGQAVMAASASGAGAGAGRGSLVIGLAASLATAGALTMPGGSPSAHGSGARVAAVRAASHGSTGQGARASSAPPVLAADATGTSGSTGTGASSGVAASSGATTTASTTATPPVARPPAWVALAAAGSLGDTSSGSTAGSTGTGGGSSTAGATDGGSSTRGGSTTASSTSASGSGSSTASGSSSGSTSASGSGSSTSGSSTSGSSTSGSSTSGSSTSGSSTSGGGGQSPGASGTGAGAILPAGTCTGVDGFSGVSSAPAVPPLASAAVVDMLDTGAVALSGSGAPRFSGSGTVGTSPNSAGTPVTVTAGTCLGQGGSLLAVDLSGPRGDEVQLVGSLVSAPSFTPAGTGSPAGATASTPAAGNTVYLFRGSVTQIGGVFPEGGSLPWGISSSFVAELQVAQPAATADLTVAFVQPAPGDTTGGTGGDTTGGTSTTSAAGGSSTTSAAGGGSVGGTGTASPTVAPTADTTGTGGTSTTGTGGTSTTGTGGTSTTGTGGTSTTGTGGTSTTGTSGTSTTGTSGTSG